MNYCCEAPETGHKKWVKQQGLKTNQGPETQQTMMQHSLRKECSAILCESVQGGLHMFILLICLILLILLIYYIARIDDEDPEYVQDHWMKKRKRSEKEEPLRADRWYYKGMDEERDYPEQSGL